MAWQQPLRPAGPEHRRHAPRPRDPAEEIRAWPRRPKRWRGINCSLPICAGGSKRSSSVRSAIWSSGTTSTPTLPLPSTLRAPSFHTRMRLCSSSTRPSCLPSASSCTPSAGGSSGTSPTMVDANALMLSVLLMCFGSLMIAVTPTYASIGVGAPALLGVARIIQGLSLGGEYGTSATYLTEVADEKHRGSYSSFQYVTLIGGQLCAILV